MENTAHGANIFIGVTLSVAVRKSIDPASPIPGSDAELAARAAWLHYAGGLTQSACAKRLGIATTRAHRLIARAARDGLVRVFVDADVASCAILEDSLVEQFSLSYCRVVPDISDNEELPIHSLGLGGADFLMKALESQEHSTIGVGHGRTLAGVVDAMAPVVASNTQFVSLMGGLTRKFAANPHDVIHRLVDKTGADAYLMPVPLFANTVKDKAVMLQQAGLTDIMQMIDDASLCVLGIGAIGTGEDQADRNMFETTETIQQLRKAGACAELLGQFLDRDGNVISTCYDNRVMALDLKQLSGRQVVAIAGGSVKTEAMLAALKSGMLTGLITDEVTARSLSDNVM